VRYNPGFSADLPLGNRVNINATTGLISGIAPTAAGDYVVTVFVDEYRNGDFISSSRKELHVSVGNCDIPRALLPERIIQCKTFSVDFENNSTSAGINSYWWDFGVAARKDDVSQVPKPTYTYPDTGVYRAKLVVNREGACPDSMTTEVRIFPGFEADFGIDGICIQLPYRFSDSSRVAYGRVNRWRWDFGITTATNDTAITANAQYAYANTGGYTIKLVASSDKGCTDSITKQLTVNDKPTIGLAFRDTLICSIDSLQLWASGSGNFSWTPGTNMLNANTASPTVFPKDTITYHVTLFDRGCVGTDSVRVNVLDFITVDAGRDTAICRTDGITLRPVSFATTYQWSPGVALSNTTIKNPVATPTDSITTYYVTANLGRCQDRDSISIRTVPYPVVNAGTDTTICFGQTAFLRGSTNTANYTWSPTTALQNPRSLQTAAAPRQSTTYRLTAWNTAGCTKPVSDDVLITVTPQIVVHAGRDTSLVLDQPLQLTGNSSVPQVVWTPAVGLNATNSLTPIVTIIRGMLPADQEFLTYNLAATSPNGCTANDEVRVRIFNTGSSIFVPSAFTPNRDGKNDIIKPILAGMRQLEYFRVYNRYGQLIYETRAQGQGWDGTLNGQPQPSSAFVYHCQAVDYTGKPLSVQGTFMLVR
jgi:gliding motility-associated-like protein